MEDEIKMPDEDVLIDLAELFKIFGDSTRVKILFGLHDGEKSVGEVASLLGMTDSAISHQLKILKDSKLVRGRRDGKQIYYSLDDDHVLSILNQGIEHVCEWFLIFIIAVCSCVAFTNCDSCHLWLAANNAEFYWRILWKNWWKILKKVIWKKKKII